jgi:DNA replication protein DnaC
MIEKYIVDYVNNHKLASKYPIYYPKDYLLVYEFLSSLDLGDKLLVLKYDKEQKSYYITKKSKVESTPDTLGLLISPLNVSIPSLEVNPNIKQELTTYHTNLTTLIRKGSTSTSTSLIIIGSLMELKSRVLDSLVNEFLKSNISPIYLKYNELYFLFRTLSYSNDLLNTINELKNAKLVFLDNLLYLTKDSTYDFIDTFIIPILEYRIANNNPTIISSAYNLTQLDTRFADSKATYLKFVNILGQYKKIDLKENKKTSEDK